MFTQATRIADVEIVHIKCVNSLGPVPHYANFKDGEDVLVRFKSGHYTVGRVRDLGGKLYVLFFTGRGSKCKQLYGY